MFIPSAGHVGTQCDVPLRSSPMYDIPLYPLCSLYVAPLCPHAQVGTIKIADFGLAKSLRMGGGGATGKGDGSGKDGSSKGYGRCVQEGAGCGLDGSGKGGAPHVQPTSLRLRQ